MFAKVLAAPLHISDIEKEIEFEKHVLLDESIYNEYLDSTICSYGMCDDECHV